MKRIVTAAEMKHLDDHTIHDMGMPSCVLMERAALAMKEEIVRRFPDGCRVLCVCGTGNNGGDGIAVARMLHLAGYEVCILAPGPEEKRSAENRSQMRIAENYGVPFAEEEDFDGFDVIVDAIFGIGLSRRIGAPWDRIVGKINEADAFVIACDISSGILAGTGQVPGCAVAADLTVTFAFPKAGQLLYPGRAYTGKLVTADIGITCDREESSGLFCVDEKDLAALTARVPWGNKATFGKIGIIGGAPGMAGAVCLSALGAFATGAGMVKIQTAEENRVPLQSRLPEAMIGTDRSGTACRALADWADVFVIGPGLGQSPAAEETLCTYLRILSECRKPAVLDADALNLLSRHGEWKEYIGRHIVMTPHPGEMSRLCGRPVEEILQDPLSNAREEAARWGCVLVQKDACTVTAGQGNRMWLNPSGNDGMATAGSGDVLSGITAGMLCAALGKEQTDPAFAAACAVWLHGCGGDAAARKKGRHGMTAQDIAEGAAIRLRDLWKDTEE